MTRSGWESAVKAFHSLGRSAYKSLVETERISSFFPFSLFIVFILFICLFVYLFAYLYFITL